MSIEERFWSKVNVRSADECWPWTASTVDGYGQFFPIPGRRVKAHRFAYELVNLHPCPDGLVADHTCHDPTECDGGTDCPHRRCCNPDHLEFVTRRANRAPERTSSPERRATHCAQGHEYTSENTYIRTSKTGSADSN